MHRVSVRKDLVCVRPELVGLAVLLALLAGCGNTQAPDSPTSSPTAQMSQQPSIPQNEPSIPDQIVRAWEEAGAKFGWMANLKSLFGFVATKEEWLLWLPDFL
ncbi:MAG: hypothetical protein ACPL7K_00420, partial [Armatimonadota bacterium]